jgi:hypothetical protein
MVSRERTCLTHDSLPQYSLVLPVMHPLLITMLLLAAAIGCPVAASVTHCMMHTREVLTDTTRQSADSQVTASCTDGLQRHSQRSEVATCAAHALGAQGMTARISLLNFAANPPPMVV